MDPSFILDPNIFQKKRFTSIQAASGIMLAHGSTMAAPNGFKKAGADLDRKSKEMFPDKLTQLEMGV